MSLEKTNSQLFPNNLSFSLKCPWCLKIITAENFSGEQLSVTYLQNYFTSQEKQYKEELLVEMQQVIENSPLVIQLREENNALKTFIEGYKLGKEFVKPVQKGLEFEDYVHEKLQEIFSGSDTVENITHARTSSGTRADILQTIHAGKELEKTAGKIIYEVKNTEKWENNWVEKLEKDMKTHQADFGIIVATCYKQPLLKPYPHKNIFFTNSENFAFAGQIARLLIIQKHKLEGNNKLLDKDQRIDNLEKWIKEKMPYYAENLHKQLDKWEKEINSIMGSVRKMIEARDYIRKMIFEQMLASLKEL
ncbi:MAG: DUF2130 domain-containing protein [Candidatus Moeniiplasma glomeromycotorum]|nr:DUF2130 domain-containing protein [Candidatus Moeniiplasma glomeromycotorum]MCE8162199.1 DUF2130 domain-containing protein [Candidatus Moeniiplasma glomeromycotorum]MCE8166145.1 DUF2130 domain-containing protein [Candidatus Moeniiplasma glomeromycotorum]MCE8166598.1 DUF2130 domain-containing protein [Candidatus Moeniiplasma glomeromycotorum]